MNVSRIVESTVAMYYGTKQSISNRIEIAKALVTVPKKSTPIEEPPSIEDPSVEEEGSTEEEDSVEEPKDYEKASKAICFLVFARALGKVAVNLMQKQEDPCEEIPASVASKIKNYQLTYSF